MKAKGRTDYSAFRRKNPLSPRMKQAVRLYATGQVKTKRAAALAVGLSPRTFYIASAPCVADPQMDQLYTSVDQMVNDATLDTRRLIDLLGRKAIGKLGNLMETGEDDSIKLRAAIDLADRSAETAKTHKVQVESLHISREDSARLTEAIVSAAAAKEKYAHLADENYIKLDGGLKDAEGEAGGLSSAEGQANADSTEANEEGEVVRGGLKLLGPGD